MYIYIGNVYTLLKRFKCHPNAGVMLVNQVMFNRVNIIAQVKLTNHGATDDDDHDHDDDDGTDDDDDDDDGTDDDGTDDGDDDGTDDDDDGTDDGDDDGTDDCDDDDNDDGDDDGTDDNNDDGTYDGDDDSPNLHICMHTFIILQIEELIYLNRKEFIYKLGIQLYQNNFHCLGEDAHYLCILVCVGSQPLIVLTSWNNYYSLGSSGDDDGYGDDDDDNCYVDDDDDDDDDCDDK